MPEGIDLIVRAIAIGVVGAVAMDLWSAVLRRRFGIPSLDYALLSRWIGHMPRGRFVHDRIASVEPVAGERHSGWAAR